MYSHLEPVEQVAIRTSVATAWAALALSGVGGTWFTGISVVTAIEPSWIIRASSALTLVASLVALFGIIRGGRQWWFEWIGAGLAGMGLVYYVAIPLGYLLSGETGRMQQSGVVLAAMSFVVCRIVSCWAHARKLRRQHDAEQKKILEVTGEIPNE